MIYANRGTIFTEGYTTDLLSDLSTILDHLIVSGVNRYEIEAAIEISMDGAKSGEEVVQKAIGKEVACMMDPEILRAMVDDLK